MPQPKSDRIDDLMKAAFGEPLLEGPPPHPVDERLLEQYHNNELDQLSADHISLLVANYRDWHDASMEVLTRLADEEEARETVSAALLLQWMAAHRRRMLIAASLVLLAGVTFWMSSGGSELRDGDLLVAYRDGKVTGLDTYPEELREQAAAALAGEAPQPASIARLSASIPVVRDPNREPSSAIMHPYGTAVRSDRPEFAWEPLDGVEGYQIEVYAAGDDTITVTAEVAEPRWTPDEPLERGQAYRWRVIYVTGEGEFVAPRADERPAVFSVIDDSHLAEVERAEASVGDSELLLGVVAYGAGLLDEAQLHWRRLLESNPDNPLAKSLLDNIERARKPKEP